MQVQIGLVLNHPAAVPGLGQRGLVGVALHLELKAVTGARFKPNGDVGVVHGGGLAADGNGVELMLAVAPRLHHHGAGVGLTGIDQRHRHGVGRKLVDERGNVLRRTRAAFVGVEVAQAAMQGPEFARSRK